MNMILEFFQTDTRLSVAWVSSGVAVVVQKFGFNILEYELWKIIAMDILTFTLLIITIMYTIKKWRRLNKLLKKEEQEVKKIKKK